MGGRPRSRSIRRLPLAACRLPPVPVPVTVTAMPSASSSMRPLRRIAIVGAGWAGLAAAVRAAQGGLAVSVFEASRSGGGRARAVPLPLPDGREVMADNGQHILIGAYSETLRLMRLVGAEPQRLLLRLPLALAYPDGTGLALPAARWLPAPLDAAWGIARARGWPWRARLALLRRALAWQCGGFACGPQASVADLCRGLPGQLLRDFIEPLCVSALNTAMHEASGAVFLRVLRDALFGVRGGSNLLLPRVPLGDLWPEPALRWLQERGARLHMGQRVQGLQAENAGWRVHWQAGDEACSALFDAVILATAAPHAAQLAGEAITPPAWPHAPRLQAWRACAAALRHTAITTVYAQAAPEAIAAAFARPMLALRSGPAAPAQFAFALDAMRLRGAEGRAQQAAEPSAEPNAEPNVTGLLAFVISNSAGQERQALCAAVAVQAQSQLGLAVNVLRSVSEKRATFACTPALPRPAAAIAPGLAACGDYVQGPYPATLEGAMRSGWQALDQAQAAFP